MVEEKRGFIEDQLVRILYNCDASTRPRSSARRDETGAPLLPSEGELTPTDRRGRGDRAAAPPRRTRESPELRAAAGPPRSRRAAPSPRRTVKLQRTPYFCSGCPHNTSTRVPEGSRAMAGIGCHGMALCMPSRRTTTYHAHGRRGRRPGSARRRSPARSTSSRTSATAPTPIPACWRSAPPRPPASTSPTRSSTTTRSR